MSRSSGRATLRKSITAAIFVFVAVDLARAATTLTFAPVQTFPAGAGPSSVAAVDLNGDGKPDLAVFNASDLTISVFLNTTATGADTVTLSPQQTLEAPTNSSRIVAADIDGDGRPDLVVNGGIFINTTIPGSSAITFAAVSPFPVDAAADDFAVADINTNGEPDIVVANRFAGTVTVLVSTTARGSTKATFVEPKTFPAGASPISVAIADVNGDGLPDLLVANDLEDGTLTVLLNASLHHSLAFGSPQTVASIRLPSAVAAADLNQDGRPDLIDLDSDGFLSSVLLNTTPAAAGTATFAAPQSFPATGWSPTTADLNGDGKLDLIVASGGSFVDVQPGATAPGASAPSFGPAQRFLSSPTGYPGAASVSVADMNGDGKLDMIVPNDNDDTVAILLNTTAMGGVNPDQHGLTGSWYNPRTSGQGLEIELYPDLLGAGRGFLFAGWFSYDVTAIGGQRWYALEGAVTSTSPTAVLGIYSGRGGNFAAPPAVPATQVGTATLTFTDCNDAVLDYAFYDGRTGTIPLLRITENITCGTDGDNGSAPSNYLLSGSWYDASTSGQGFVFDINPAQENFFAAWYTYAPGGAQIGGAASERWYTIQAGLPQGAASISGAAIYATGGGIFDVAGLPTTAPVGSADIQFASCTAATLKYTFTAGVNAGLSGTLQLTRTGPAPQGCSL